MTRRRPAHRLTSAIIGAIIAALGVLTGALLSGRNLDTELIAIIALAAAGVWLLLTALLAARRPRSGAWATGPSPDAWATTGSWPTQGDPAHGDTPPHGEPPLKTAARTAASKAQARAPKKGADAS